MASDAKSPVPYGLRLSELVFIFLVLHGYSDKEMSAHFDLEKTTIEDPLANIFTKLNVSTREELARFAMKHSLPIPKMHIAKWYPQARTSVFQKPATHGRCWLGRSYVRSLCWFPDHNYPSFQT